MIFKAGDLIAVRTNIFDLTEGVVVRALEEFSEETVRDEYVRQGGGGPSNLDYVKWLISEAYVEKVEANFIDPYPFPPRSVLQTPTTDRLSREHRLEALAVHSTRTKLSPAAANFIADILARDRALTVKQTEYLKSLYLKRGEYSKRKPVKPAPAKPRFDEDGFDL